MRFTVLIAFATLSIFAQSFESWFVVNPPSLSAFSWVNQQSATWTAPNGIPIFTVPYHASPANWNSLVQSLPGSTYTLTLIFVTNFTAYGTFHFGITLQDASSPIKAENIMLVTGNGESCCAIIAAVWVSNFSTNAIGCPGTNCNALFAHWPRFPAQRSWIKITDDGSHRTYYSSVDNGWSWNQEYQEASGSFTIPDQVGISAYSLNTQAFTYSFTIWQFTVLGPSSLDPTFRSATGILVSAP